MYIPFACGERTATVPRAEGFILLGIPAGFSGELPIFGM
jgi:hypothetical protein